jgi:hypothetical protein
MAKQSGRNNSELKDEIARSRARVARDLRSVRDELDFPRKIRNSIRREPVPWIAGAAAVGVLIVWMALRKKKVYVDAKPGARSKHRLVEAGFALGAVRIAAALLKPVIENFIAKKVSGYVSERSPKQKW